MSMMCQNQNRTRVLWFLALVVLAIDAYLFLVAPPYEYANRSLPGIRASKCLPVVVSTRELQTGNPGSDSAPNASAEIGCSPGIPCEYPEVVDLRVIVLTFNRHTSLAKLLGSLDDLILDGDSGSLEIWIDRDKHGRVHDETLEKARLFRWRHGPTRVHVQSEHVGIYGQWIDTWRPRENSTELGLILEDDMCVSKFAYRWLKAVSKRFHKRADISGYTLQSENVNKATGGGPIHAPREDIVFLYQLLGSWGFAPHPETWRDFQNWYHVVSRNQSFHPYVEGLVMTSWFKTFEKRHTQDSMWTMWYIYYANEHKLFTVYSNLNLHIGSGMNCLAVNRAEPGLHFSGKPKDNTKNLLQHWDDSYVDFAAEISKFNFNGETVQ